jgi:hypothetical protein
MESIVLCGIVDGYMSKKGLGPEWRSLPPTAIGGGIGSIGTLLANIISGDKVTKNLLRNSLIGSGLGFGSSLLFPGFGLGEPSKQTVEKKEDDTEEDI